MVNPKTDPRLNWKQDGQILTPTISYRRRINDYCVWFTATSDLGEAKARELGYALLKSANALKELKEAQA